VFGAFQQSAGLFKGPGFRLHRGVTQGAHNGILQENGAMPPLTSVLYCRTGLASIL